MAGRVALHRARAVPSESGSERRGRGCPSRIGAGRLAGTASCRRRCLFRTWKTAEVKGQEQPLGWDTSRLSRRISAFSGGPGAAEG